MHYACRLVPVHLQSMHARTRHYTTEAEVSTQRCYHCHQISVSDLHYIKQDKKQQNNNDTKIRGKESQKE